MEDSVVFAMFAGFMIFFFILGIISIIGYILMAIGLFNIAKKFGMKDKAWLAWVPIANMLLLTMLVENDVHESIRGKLTLITGIALVSSILLAWLIPPLYFLPVIFALYAFYFVAKRFSKNEVAHVVIAAITGGLSLCIQLFMFGRREPIQ
ncbi:hypothetical protein [Lentibacillus saliphilus]|uniref:hypothetical protein n=1 Tax=Lentibacillus saliphilus TaxID=2737028 RepID=UPI001C310EA3|nr:hypothetical protein [Lentibacillus saliphilus]